MQPEVIEPRYGRKVILGLIPLLMLYLGLISFTHFQSHREGCMHDEDKYFFFARNLSDGFFSPRDQVDLWAGPGWPLILVPMTFSDHSLFLARTSNALLLYAALIYFWLAARLYVNPGKAFVLTLLLAFYPPILVNLQWAHTETLTVLLVCAVSYHLCRLHRAAGFSKVHFLAGAFFAAYLALTKVFFGYVLLGMVLLNGLFAIVAKGRGYRTNVAVFAFSLALCSPYLIYTYSLTGKVFYWGTSGGMSLFWLTTPYPGEVGDWKSAETVAGDSRFEHHWELFETAAGMSQVEADDYYKARALENIRRYPFKCFLNWVSNVGRLLFNFPYSHAPQTLRTYLYAIPTMFLLPLAGLAFHAMLRNRGHIPPELATLSMFFILAFAGSSVLSAYARMFTVLVPVLWLLIIASLHRWVRLTVTSPAEHATESDRG